MSRIITPPDTDFGSSYHKILVANAAETDIEMLTLYLKQLYEDVDVYLYRDEFDNSEWALDAATAAGKAFNFPSNTIQDVITYLKTLNDI